LLFLADFFFPLRPCLDCKNFGPKSKFFGLPTKQGLKILWQKNLACRACRDATRPRPGQRDVSRPQVTLPPGVQELADEVISDAPGARTTPPAPQRAPDPVPLLDWLLSP
jgi:hypothetical protein